MELLRYLVQANLILAVMVLAYALLLRRTTRFALNRAVLWVIAFEAVCLPFAKLPTVQPEPVRAVVHQTTEVFRKPFRAIIPSKPEVFLTMPNGKTYPAAFNATASRFPNWSDLGWLYSAVILLLLIRLGWRIVRLRILIENGMWTQYTDFVLVQAPVVAPFSFGRFVVLNIRKYSHHELDQILRHERVHVSQHHTLDVLLAECLSIVFWFNPVVYLFRRLVTQNLEYLADRSVLGEGVDARAYQFSLLRVSMGSCGPTLATRFGESGIKDRIKMMLRPRSGVWAWLRYWLLAGVLAIVMTVLSCGRVGTSESGFTSNTNLPPLICSNLDWLNNTFTEDKDEWTRHIQYMPGNQYPTQWLNHSVISLTKNHLQLTTEHLYDAQVFINCEPTTPDQLTKIESEFIDGLVVYEQAPYSEKAADKPWVILVTTSPRPMPSFPIRNHFLTYLQAAALTDHPLGNEQNFSMNDVLEATFFHRKNLLMERTKNEHLKLYDEFIADTDILINGIQTDAKGLQTVHVREVDKVFIHERPFHQWYRPKGAIKRFHIDIETSPNRTKRDSSYYVFSPFYSGDF